MPNDAVPPKKPKQKSYLRIGRITIAVYTIYLFQNAIYQNYFLIFTIHLCGFLTKITYFGKYILILFDMQGVAEL